MLSLRVYSRCINHYLKQSQLHTSVKLLTPKDSSSSLSSSDSSDSDSDKESTVEKKQTTTVKKESDEFLSSEKTNERLNALLLKITETSKVKGTLQQPKVTLEPKSTVTQTEDTTPSSIDVAIKSRKIRFKSQQEKKKGSIEQQIVGAAKDVAESLGGDTKKTELELLDQILNLRPKEDKKPSELKDDKESETIGEVNEKSSLSDLLSSMKVDQPSTTLDERNTKMAKKVKERFNKDSIALTLLYQKSQTKRPKQKPQICEKELNGPSLRLNIFKNLAEEPQNIPRLSTWEEMEKKEMKLATLTTPRNIFQELIQWTEQGKLWHFPINNEQGLEEEEKVHFSEHVFMERHLKGWCPKKGPIRHFMELVCTGLSKNSYMTVEEKLGHIKWYENYFEERKDLLNELGALGQKAPTAEKQIEA